MAKITIKELESLIPNDAARILREDGSDSEWCFPDKQDDGHVDIKW
jgi:hypothetical protein